MRQFLCRLRILRRLRQAETELAEELAFHREMKQQELEQRGVDPIEAGFAARRALGNVTLARDRAHDVWVPRWLQGLGQDGRLALRTFRATPVVSGVAILSLVLGIGANTAMFSVINALLIRSLPVAEPERLVLLSGRASPNQRWTYAIWEGVQRRAQAFKGAAAWGGVRMNLAPGGEVQPAEGLFVNGDFFTTLGVPALLGRVFSAADDVRLAGPDGPVVVISYPFWQRYFGGSFHAVGTSIRIESVPFTVIGVTPPDFFGPEVGRLFDVALPLGTEPLIRGRDTALDHRTNFWLHILLRLRRDQSSVAARDVLRAMQPDIREAAMPQASSPVDPRSWFLVNPFDLVPAARGVSELRPRYQQQVLVLLAVVGSVLLIACGNLANLLLARAAARRQELSVRLALGASTWRLARQLLTESVLLSMGGAVGGIVFAIWGSRALIAELSTPASPVFLDVSIDARVLMFTAVVTIATTVVSGTAPAWRAARMAAVNAIRPYGRAPASSRPFALSGSLLVAQIALSFVLVVVAGLLIETLARLARVSPGFDDRVVIFNVNANRVAVNRGQRPDLYQRMAQTVAALPGVAKAAASVTTPLNGSVWGGNRITVPGDSAPPGPGTALVNFVTPDWFATYGTPLVAGRDIDAHDTVGSQLVTVVNEAFARAFYPAGPALGRQVIQWPNRTTRTIVGIVGNAAYGSLREPVKPTMYVPLQQFDWSEMSLPGISLSVRSANGSPAALVHSVAAALMSVDQNLAFNIRFLQDQVGASLMQERLMAGLSGFFSLLALLLAGLGLYGVSSYAVSRRWREIGIRVALGAVPLSVVRVILSPVSVQVALGIVIGGVASLWASRFVAALLYGLQPGDPRTLAESALLLATIAALAAGLPAWRASRIDPAVVMRES